MTVDVGPALILLMDRRARRADLRTLLVWNWVVTTGRLDHGSQILCPAAMGLRTSQRPACLTVLPRGSNRFDTKLHRIVLLQGTMTKERRNQDGDFGVDHGYTAEYGSEIRIADGAWPLHIVTQPGPTQKCRL